MSVSPLPRPRVAAWRAFQSGGLVSVHLRPGSRSPWVLVCAFRSRSGAARFAGRWAARAGRSVVLRRSPAGWSVSAPVSVRSSRPLPSPWLGRIIPAAGGVQRFAARLRSTGLAHAR